MFLLQLNENLSGMGQLLDVYDVLRWSYNFRSRDGLFTKRFLIPQANNTQLTRKEREMWNITTKALLHLGAVLVVDVFFHYLYILTIPSDMKLVTKLSDWCLGELEYAPGWGY